MSPPRKTEHIKQNSHRKEKIRAPEAAALSGGLLSTFDENPKKKAHNRICAQDVR